MEIFDITDDNGFPTGETVSRSDAHDNGMRDAYTGMSHFVFRWKGLRQ